MEEKHISIKNDVQELSRIVTFIQELEEEWGLPMAQATTINLVLEEAISNIVFYAFEDEEEHEIDVQFRKNKDTLEIEIVDDGVPYNPTKKVDPDTQLSAEERQIGGLGIYLIKQFMDEVKYERNGGHNHLTMIKKR